MSDIPAVPAISVGGLGLYVAPPVEMDGVNRPREAWRSLMRVAGITSAGGDDPQVTHAAGGYVLRDVSFDVAAGTVVCLTPAADESSALLRILAGVTVPTSGGAQIHGPVTPLLAVGDNCDPRLTAYENILALPDLAGAPPEMIAARVKDVLDFAELHGFEHAALRTFSTGMVLRLSVALALCGQPAIVLIDDVLAVGDIGFQQRCVDRVYQLKEAGCTLVLAWSDDALVRQLATRVITFSGGRVVADSSPADLEPPQAGQSAESDWTVLSNLPENDVMALRSVDVQGGRDEAGTFLDLRAIFEARVPSMRCRPVLAVAGARTVLFRSVYPSFVALDHPGPVTFSVRVPTSALPTGDYAVGFHMASVVGSAIYALKAFEAVSLTIRRAEPPAASDPAPQLNLALAWEIERVAESAA